MAGSWVAKTQGGEFTKLALSEGETFEGVFLGSKSITGANGDFTAHELQDEDGNAVSATGASLNNQLADVEPGSRVRLTYEGLKKTKTPGRTVKSYIVEVYVEEAALIVPARDKAF